VILSCLLLGVGPFVKDLLDSCSFAKNRRKDYFRQSPPLHEASNWQLDLPWILPEMEPRRAAAGIRASVWCNSSCQANYSCEPEQVKICFWDESIQCKCRDPVLFPTEWQGDHGRHNDQRKHSNKSIAVLMAGQTRSFSSVFMREYWRSILANLKKHVAEVVLFAVLSRQSSNGKIYSGSTVFRKQRLKEFLADLHVVVRSAFPFVCTWQEAAVLVKDPALQFLLSPPEHLQGTAPSGLFNTCRCRAVAFDLMLQFEKENRKTFTHVLFVRPDIFYDLVPNVPKAIASCPGAVQCFNDQFATMERNLAPWFATHIATIRSLTGGGRVPANINRTSQKIQDLLGWKFQGNGRGGIFMPAMHLAIHGVPFVGANLEVINISFTLCGPFLALRGVWLVRNRGPNSSKVCITGGKGKYFGDVINRLGMNVSAENDVAAC